MANKSVTLEQLPDAIKAILDEYEGEITRNIPEITERVGKEGVKAVRNSAKAKFNGTGKYAKGWRTDIERKRLETNVTIYNAKLPGLPHLLENGHANRNGGRTPGRVHIAPVEEKLVKDFERKIENELTRSG